MPTYQSLFDTLTYYFLKQASVYLAEAGLSPPQMTDGAVVRHTIQQVQSQIPPQRHICLDPLLNLPLRRDAVQISHQQIFYQNDRVNGRAAIPMAVQLVSFLICER